MKTKYYDGTRLLSLTDINGKRPEIYICTANRTGGKTTFFNRLLVNRFLKSGEKFCLLYRYKYELSDIADKFFKDIRTLFFQGYSMYTEPRAKGIYHEIFLAEGCDEEAEGKPCGYAICLNAADQIKKYSHIFSDVQRILFDEFQSETNSYCSREVEKFLSVHTSVARGQGEMVRYVPVYMVSNPVTMLNPYYIAMGISDRLRSDTHFLRGDGYVMEQGYVEAASEAQKASGFNRAFSDHSYIAYSAEAVYLNDNLTFIDKPDGIGRYIATIRYEGHDYGLREYPEQGIIYCDDRPDASYPDKIAVTTDDHNINYVMLQRNAAFIARIRFLFEHGSCRFKNLQSKSAVMNMISY